MVSESVIKSINIQEKKKIFLNMSVEFITLTQKSEEHAVPTNDNENLFFFLYFFQGLQKWKSGGTYISKYSATEGEVCLPFVNCYTFPV